MMRVFKFGGASVKDASSVKNVAEIISLFPNEKIFVVISAMGKMTNLLEKIVESYWNNSQELDDLLKEFEDYHRNICKELFSSNFYDKSGELKVLKDEMYAKLRKKKSENYHFEYDQIVCFGELFSTAIVAEYIKLKNTNVNWLDVRQIIKTNNTWREARIQWENTIEHWDLMKKKLFPQPNSIVITQGFIGQTDEGFTTTLGREGSDFTASILAFISNAEDVTIWKDVPGMLNADPRYFNGTVLLEKISFREAVELAYYGASVIHPKTIQPLKNKDIPLYIKSFIKPKEAGTVIQSSTDYDGKVASYIFKPDQILISLTPKDFSFIVEDNLKDIFFLLTKQNVRINLMQNSAVSFSFLIDNKYNLEELINNLKIDYLVKYNTDVELLTIRHYDDKTIERLTHNKSNILEQKTRQTARFVLQSKNKKVTE